MECVSSQPNIVVTNVWSDDNKGDSAIVIGLLSLVRERFANARFVFLSELRADDIKARKPYRHLVAEFAQAKILPSSLSVPMVLREAVQGRRLTPHTAWMLMGLGKDVVHAAALVLLAFATRSPKLVQAAAGADREWVRAIRDSDVVLSKGGSFIYHTGGPKSALGLFTRLYPLLLAAALGRPIYMFAQSFSDLDSRLSRLLLQPILRRANRVLVRERRSYEYLSALFRPGGLGLVPDTALALTPDQDSVRVRGLIERLKRNGAPLLGVTVSRCGRGDSPVYRRYLQAVAEGLIRFAREMPALAIALVPQVIGPADYEDDRHAIEDLCALLAPIRDSITVVQEDLSPRELQALYGSMDLFLGTRLHSVILATSTGVPAVAISYFGFKTLGTMRILGQEELVLDFETVTSEELVERLRRLQCQGPSIRHDLLHRVGRLRDWLRQEIAQWHLPSHQTHVKD